MTWMTPRVSFHFQSFPDGLMDGKESACYVGDAGDADSTLGLGRSPGEGSGNPLQHSCLKNPVNGGAWMGYSPQGYRESDMTEKLSRHIFSPTFMTCQQMCFQVWQPQASFHSSSAFTSLPGCTSACGFLVIGSSHGDRWPQRLKCERTKLTGRGRWSLCLLL